MQAEVTTGDSDKWTRPAIIVVVLCFLVYAFDIYEMTTFSIATPAIMKEFGLSRVDIGLVASITRFVTIGATIVLVPLVDVYGRRVMIALGVLGYSLVAGLTGLAQVWLQMIGALSLNRIPLVLGTYPASIMATETAPQSARARAQGIQASGYAVGFLVCSSLSILVLPSLGWRYMYFLGVLPAILVYFWLRNIPESQRFAQVKNERVAEGRHPNPLQTYRDVIRAYPKQVALGTLILASYHFAFFGYSAWIPTFLNTELKLGDATSSTWLSIWYVGAILATLGGGWLCQRYGRRLTALTIIPGGILFATYLQWTNLVAVFIVGFLVTFFFFTPFGAGTWGAIQESFPTEVRATGFATTMVLGTSIAGFAPIMAGFTPTIGMAFVVYGLAYLVAVPAFLLTTETVGQDLMQKVGEHAGAVDTAVASAASPVPAETA